MLFQDDQRIIAIHRGFQLFHRQFSVPPNHLHRLAKSFIMDADPKRIVTGNRAAQGVNISVQQVCITETDNLPKHIGISRQIRQMVIDHPLLQCPQRINILDIGEASGNGGSQNVDFCLAELRPGGYFHHRAFRHVRAGFLWIGHLQLCRQFRQYGILIQRVAIHKESTTTQRQHHFQSQQRVAAQVKKVGVSADVFNAEQLTPHLNQGLLQRIFRRFNVLCREFIKSDHRKGLAVNFTAGG